MIGLMMVRAKVGRGEFKQNERPVRLNGPMHLYHMETADSRLFL